MMNLNRITGLLAKYRRRLTRNPLPPMPQFSLCKLIDRASRAVYTGDINRAILDLGYIQAELVAASVYKPSQIHEHQESLYRGDHRVPVRGTVNATILLMAAHPSPNFSECEECGQNHKLRIIATCSLHTWMPLGLHLESLSLPEMDPEDLLRDIQDIGIFPNAMIHGITYDYEMNRAIVRLAPTILDVELSEESISAFFKMLTNVGWTMRGIDVDQWGERWKNRANTDYEENQVE